MQFFSNLFGVGISPSKAAENISSALKKLKSLNESAIKYRDIISSGRDANGRSLKDTSAQDSALKKIKVEMKSTNDTVVDNMNECIKNLAYNDASKFEDSKKWVEALFDKGILYEMIHNFPVIDFETRKSVSSLFATYEKAYQTYGDRCMLVKLFTRRMEDGAVLRELFGGFSISVSVLHCGGIIRDLARVPALTSAMLNQGFVFGDLFQCVHDLNFDISSDAFITIRAILCAHKDRVAPYLVANAAMISNKLSFVFSDSHNYVAVRQGLKLISEILLDRAFVRFTLIYVAEASTLKKTMELMRCGGGSIALEAFHLFKVFVAHPTPPVSVKKILVANAARLELLIEGFGVTPGQEPDADLQVDKTTVIRRLRELAAEAQQQQQQ